MRIAFAILCLWMLAACGTPRLPELDVEEQWTNAIARQSMFAFFPLDEDVMVGDVFLNTRGAPDARDDTNFDLVRIARTPRIEVARGLCESHSERLFIAPPPPRPEPPTAGQSQPRAPARTVAPARPEPSPCEVVQSAVAARARGETVTLPASVRLADASSDNSDFRLGHASIPTLTVARLTEAQLGASGLLGNFGANLGIGGGSAVALTIELKKLQQLQIELPVAIAMLRRLILADTAVRPGAVIRIMAQRWLEGTRHLCRGEFGRLQDGMSVAIVTRVLYAGGIDYSFSRSAETAVRVALEATSILEGQPQRPTVPNLPDRNSEARAPAASADQLRDRLNAVLSSLAGGPPGTAAGGNATIAVGSLGGTALKADFPRLLAVGAGASLVYPAQDALLPQNADDIADVMAFCHDILGPLPRGSAERGDAMRAANWCAGNGSPADPRERLRAHMCNFLAVRDGARAEAQRQHSPPSSATPALPGFVPTGRILTGRARLG